jgi:hypothetical protein
MLACGLALAVLAGFVTRADAAICKYVEQDGRITYSNLAAGPQGGRKVDCFEAPAQVIAVPAPPGAAEADRSATTDDAEARSVLEQQLADEEERLDEAQRALSEQEANLDTGETPYYDYDDGPGAFVDAVRSHRRNRDRIRHELAKHGRDRGSSQNRGAAIAVEPPTGDVSKRTDSMPGLPRRSGAQQLEQRPAPVPRQHSDAWTASHPIPESGRR